MSNYMLRNKLQNIVDQPAVWGPGAISSTAAEALAEIERLNAELTKLRKAAPVKRTRRAEAPEIETAERLGARNWLSLIEGCATRASAMLNAEKVKGHELEELRKLTGVGRGTVAEVREQIVETLVGARLNSQAIRAL